MRHWLLITVVLIPLCGCQTLAGDVAIQVVLKPFIAPVVDPVVDQVIKGSKSAFAVASEVWQEFTSQENKPNEETITNQ